MIKNTPRTLLDQQLISQDEFDKIYPVVSGKVFSVFYDLQSLLYLGVMLFTTGAGILIYQNIGDMGHVISILAMSMLCGVCFWYTHKKSVPYTPLAVKSPTPYYDYILLLGSLLFVSIQGYLQFQYAILDNNLSTSTLTTALLFFFLAFRYDHVGVLSLAITSFASFWGLAVSPQKWYASNFFESANLHNVAIVFGIVMAGIALVLNRKNIKRHFTFTFFNFSFLLFFVAAVAGLFIDGEFYLVYTLLIFAGCAFAYYASKLTQSFLFLLFAFVAGYIGITFLLATTIFSELGIGWVYYVLLSCGGFVYFIIKYKNHFRHHA
jgi:hypothetical protein